jgi:hypothetical protein
MTPSPRPTAIQMQNAQRKITGPRDMPTGRSSPRANNLGTVRRKPIQREPSPGMFYPLLALCLGFCTDPLCSAEFGIISRF